MPLNTVYSEPPINQLMVMFKNHQINLEPPASLTRLQNT